MKQPLKLAIIGPGLLGGSIALAARRAGSFHISMWGRRPESVEEALSRNMADQASTDLSAVAGGADMAVLCVPVGAMPALARQLAKCLPETALVTDVGSVKRKVVQDLSGIFQGRFIGSHPMAGSDQAGMCAARAGLFDGAVCIVTPTEDSAEIDVSAVSGFWKDLGCRVKRLSPEEHDELVASISHFPHLLSALLVRTVEGLNPAAFDLAGPGFRDTTRVAAGPPEMWVEIFQANSTAVKKSAEAMIEKLREALTLLERLENGDHAQMTELLRKAKTRRDSLRLPE
jgi:prephenate dehydrogenase